MITPRLPGYMSPQRSRPAGQAWSDTLGIGSGLVPSDVGTGSGSGSGGTVTLGKPVVETTPPASSQGLYDTVGNAIGTTGTTIAAIIASNNQTQIAQLQAQTQLQLAQLQQQSHTLTDPLAIQRAAAQAAALQQFQMQLASRQGGNQTMYLVVALAAGIVGFVVLSKRGRRSGSRSMARTRTYRSR